MSRKLEFPPLFKEASEKRLIFVLLLSLLISPLLLSGFSKVRQSVFVEPPSQEEAFAFYREQIFNQKSDIDFLFVGPCTTWWQVFPESFAEVFEKQWHRPVVALNFGYNHFSEDLRFLLIREILQKRNVKYLVLSTPRPADGNGFPHPNAFKWWTHYPEVFSDLHDLSFGSHFRLYSASVMGSLRTLPRLLRGRAISASEDPGVTEFGTKIRPASGQIRLQKNWTDSDAVFTGWNQDLAQGSDSLSSKQLSLLKSVAKLAHKSGTEIIWLSSPLKSDFAEEILIERVNWFSEFPGSKLIGIPPAWIKNQNPDWSTMFDGQNLTTEASKWMSQNWARSLSTLLSSSPK